jgi:tripartite-type tricarboxylate transporter receptor subunit TctC
MPVLPRILPVALMLTMASGLAHAQGPDADARNYPNRTIRMVVPFPPGGPADLIARFVGQKMSEDFGQPVVIENRAGGNTAIGAQMVARSAPDGYTLFVPMDTTMVMNPLVRRTCPTIRSRTSRRSRCWRTTCCCWWCVLATARRPPGS